MDGGTWWTVVHGVVKSRTRLSDFTFTFHFLALEKEMATHSSVLAWRIPGMGELDGLPSLGSQSRTRLKRLSSSSSNEITVYQKDMRGAQTSLWTQLIRDTISSISSKIPSSSHVLASLRSGCWPQLASSSWWSKGGCHCLVFLPGSRTTQGRPLSGSASKVITTA